MVKEYEAKYKDIYDTLKKKVIDNHIICIDDYLLEFIERDKQLKKYSFDEKEEFKQKGLVKLRTLYETEKECLNLKLISYLNILDEDSDAQAKAHAHSIIQSQNTDKPMDNKYYFIVTNTKIKYITSVSEFMDAITKHPRINSMRERLSKQIEEQNIQQKTPTRKPNSKESYSLEVTSEEIITDLQKVFKNIFYRGHSKVNYSLLPGIFRDNLLQYESDMYFDLLVKCPKDFRNSNRHLDILKEMQHYGMATRLLDITANPLVALFFIVSGQEEFDGEINIFNTESETVKTNYSDVIEILSALATFNIDIKRTLVNDALKYVETCENNENIKIDKRERISEDSISKFNDEKSTKLLLHEIRQHVGDFQPIINPYDLFNTYFVRPLQNNDRIIRQDGLFIVAGLGMNPAQEEYKHIQNSINKHRFTIEDDNTPIRYIIPAQYKKNIAFELSLMGISKQYIYPELESISSHIKKEYSNK